SRTAIRPLEFVFSRPCKAHGFTRIASQPGRFQFAFRIMLPSITSARVGNDDTHAFRRELKGLGNFVAHREWRLRSAVNGKLVTAPLRDSRSRFEGNVSDVPDLIARFVPVAAAR